MLLPLLFNLNNLPVYQVEGTGGFTLAGSALASGTFEASVKFSWQIGEPIERFFRVETICAPTTCDTTGIDTDQTCDILWGVKGEQLIFNVLARSVSEVCEKLRNREFIVPIKSIKVFTRPAFKSDRALLEAQDEDEDFTCNELDEVPFCTQGACLEFCLDYDLTVPVVATVSGGFTYFYEGTGGFTLGGSAVVASPNYSYVGTGGLVLGGSAVAEFSTDLGEFEVKAVATVAISDIGVTFGTVDGVTLEPTDDLVIVDCDCTPLPVVLQLTHEINRKNEFANFLVRNSFTLNKILPLRYNKICKSWQYNSQFIGIGRDGVTQERWRLVFEWACTDNLGSYDLGNAVVWKFSMYMENKNLTSNLDFDTRILVAFPSQGVCIGELKLNWGFNINTSSLDITTTNSSVFVDYKILQDGIGLFKSQSWIDDPILGLGISQLTNSGLTNTFDIRPIFPPSAKKLLGDGETVQNAFVPAG